MPVRRTTKNGKPAYKYGTSGKAYSYQPGNPQSRGAAKGRAKKQAQAINARRNRSRLREWPPA